MKKIGRIKWIEAGKMAAAIIIFQIVFWMLMFQAWGIF